MMETCIDTGSIEWLGIVYVEQGKFDRTGEVCKASAVGQEKKTGEDEP